MFWAADKRQTPSIPPSPPPPPVSSAEEKQFALGDPMQSVVLHGFQKKPEKKSKNKQKGGKKTCERGTSLLIKPHAPEFWWSRAGSANIQHLFFDYQWLTYCSVPQTLIKSHSAHEDPTFHSARMKMSVIVPVRLPLL